jgi:hypothetical protein
MEFGRCIGPMDRAKTGPQQDQLRRGRAYVPGLFEIRHLIASESELVSISKSSIKTQLMIGLRRKSLWVGRKLQNDRIEKT